MLRNQSILFYEISLFNFREILYPIAMTYNRWDQQDPTYVNLNRRGCEQQVHEKNYETLECQLNDDTDPMGQKEYTKFCFSFLV